jgi:truncated hemoglobin YjbI
MTNQPSHDPVPPFAREVLSLFREALAEVRFPSVDREVLESAAEAACAAQVEVEQLERTLADARARVVARVEALTELSQRALAYARIFAETDEALAEEVERIAHSQRVSVTGSEKRRGRPRKKTQDDGESLFQGVGLSAPAQAAAE